MIAITDALPSRVLRFGAVVASGVSATAVPDGFEAALTALLAERTDELPDALDRRRISVREALRHGTYRPAGRSKPCPEYLLRTAQDDAFPRINALVDAANLVCLSTMLPVSIFDLDLAGADRMTLRYGRTGESYVFNPAGQEIDLEDLVLGAAEREGGDVPLVNPVKDGMGAKTHAESSRVGVLLYAPVPAEAALEAAVRDLAGWLRRCGPAESPPHVASGIVPAGGTLRLSK